MVVGVGFEHESLWDMTAPLFGYDCRKRFVWKNRSGILWAPPSAPVGRQQAVDSQLSVATICQPEIKAQKFVVVFLVCLSIFA